MHGLWATLEDPDTERRLMLRGLIREFHYPSLPGTSTLIIFIRYDDCDVGTFVNQTNKDGKTPAIAVNTGKGWEQYDGRLSVLNGQRLRSV